MKLKNLTILSISQALALTSGPIVLLVGGFIGTKLAPTPALSTLPLTITVVGTAIFIIPAVLLMKHIGRKNGFIASSFVASISSFGAAYAIATKDFILFCLFMVFIGGNLAFAMQYRFAAAESVEKQYIPKAVSFVLFGGIAAGFIGPEIAKRTKDLSSYGEYTATFFILAVLLMLVAFIFLSMKDIRLQEETTSTKGRPLKVIIVQPLYLLALLAGTVAFGVMTYIMAATPISMHLFDNLSLDKTTFVVQSHMVAMYLPSLFTGLLINRIGVFRLMLIGTILMFACVGLGLAGHEFVNYFGALVLLGVGWNFLFVGQTVLLPRSYLQNERYKAQAANDFIIFGVRAVITLSAGAVIAQTSWEFLNILVLPFLLVLLMILIKSRGRISAPTQETSLV